MKQKLLTLVLASVLIIGTVGAGLLLLPTSAPVSASVASGDSMGHSGQTVVVHADVGGYTVGDAVVFSADGDSYHHRIVGESSEGFITQGDAEPVTDQEAVPGIDPVSESQIHGQALFVVPSGYALGGLLVALSALVGAVAWTYRPGAVRSVVRAGWSIPIRRIATVAVVLLLVVSGVPFGGLIPQSDHSGTVLAESTTDNVTYSASADNTVKAINASDGTVIWTFTGHSNTVNDVAVGPDGDYVYSAADSTDGTIRKINASDGSQVWSFSGHSSSAALTVAVAPDGGAVYSGGGDNALRAINASDGTEIWNVSDYGSSVWGTAVGPNSEVVYASSQDQNVRAFHASNGSEIWINSNYSNLVTRVTAGPDGETVYTGDYGSNVKALDASDGSEKWTFTGHSGEIFGLSVGPAGEVVYSGSYDNTAKAINTSDGTEKWTFTGHSGSVDGISTSRDGGTVYTGSRDDTVKALDASDASEIWTFTGHTGDVKSVAGGGEVASIEPVSVSVTDSDGNAVDGATVEAVNTSTGNTAASGTTDSSGNIEFTLDAGEYDITAEHPTEDWTTTKTVNVPSGGTSVELTLSKPDDGKYEQAFELDDQTGGKFADADLRIERATDSMGPGAIVTTDDWTTIDETTFNHNDKAFSRLEDGAYYRLKLTDDFSTWTYNGFHAIEDNGAFYLRPGRLENTTNETDYNVTSDNITLVSGDDGLVIEYDGEPVDSIDYNISDPETGEYVEGDIDFEEPTDYYEGNFDDDILTNNTTGAPDYDEWEADYEGVYSNGSQFNGSVQATSLDGFSLDTRNGTDDDSGGFAAPAGGSGGGTPTWVIGIPAVAAIGYVVLRRRRGGA